MEINFCSKILIKTKCRYIFGSQFSVGVEKGEKRRIKSVHNWNCQEHRLPYVLFDKSQTNMKPSYINIPKFIRHALYRKSFQLGYMSHHSDLSNIFLREFSYARSWLQLKTFSTLVHYIPIPCWHICKIGMWADTTNITY